MRLRITSNGTTADTQVEVVKDGVSASDIVEGVVAIEWSCALGPQGQPDWCKAVITLVGVEVDIVGVAADELLVAPS